MVRLAWLLRTSDAWEISYQGQLPALGKIHYHTFPEYKAVPNPLKETVSQWQRQKLKLSRLGPTATAGVWSIPQGTSVEDPVLNLVL